MRSEGNPSQKTKFSIQAMDCPTEEAMIRKKLAAFQGIRGLEFNLIDRVLTVNHELPGTDGLEAAIRELGFKPELLDAQDAVDKVARLGTVAGHGKRKEQGRAVGAEVIKRWLPLALALMAALASEVFELFEILSPWLPAALAFAAILLSGLSTYKKGWIAIFNRSLNINALMSIAVSGAMIIGQWPEAAMVMTLFALSEKLEGLSLARARRAIKSLFDISPEMARVQAADGSWQMLETRLVRVGALLRVGPGERISHDGRILEGFSSIDQSAITGESLPLERGPSDSVYAGTVNQEGELIIEVGAESSNSTLSRIIHLVEEAQSSRSKTQRFVDRFAAIYTPAVFGMAILIALIPPLFFHGLWLDWIYRALVVLVIACPCALVISTPVSIVSALTRAARMGIIVKGGAALEQARKLDYIALDKTGTLTQGKAALTDMRLLSGNSLQAESLAFSLAERSQHPVSRAICARYVDSGLEKLECSNFQALPGKGIRAEIDSQPYYLGNQRLMEELGFSSPLVELSLVEFEKAGKSAVVLAGPEGVLAVFALADRVKENSKRAVAELHALGVKTIMLSGDNLITAQVIAQDVGIDEARGNQLPQDKAAVIKEMRGRGLRVAMVGDGINDAPALAHADIGIAMGLSGTDSAIETADVVLMDDELCKVPALLRLSRRTLAILGQNIGIALGIKAIFLALTLSGFGSMWMAVFADMGASLIVIFNGLRLLRGASRRRSGAETCAGC